MGIDILLEESAGSNEIPSATVPSI